MNTAKRFHHRERFHPFRACGKGQQHPLLPLPQQSERLHNPITHRRKQVRVLFAQRLQHIAREFTMVCALLDDHEIIRPAERFPNLGKLTGDQFPKQRPHAHAREIIAPPPDRAASRAVITMLGMIKRLLHEPRKGHRPARPDPIADFANQFLVFFHRSLNRGAGSRSVDRTHHRLNHLAFFAVCR